MLTNCIFDNIILKILIVLRLLFIFFFRRNLITISNDFILHIDNIWLAKIIIFMILNFSRIAIYEVHRYSNVNENNKNYRFTHNITLHAMLRLIFFVRSKTFQKSLFEIRITWILSMITQSEWISIIFCLKFYIFLLFVNLT